MATNVVELRTPQGRESLELLLDSVTITCPEDIHDAAVALARIAQERGMRHIVQADRAGKEGGVRPRANGGVHYCPHCHTTSRTQTHHLPLAWRAAQQRGAPWLGRTCRATSST